MKTAVRSQKSVVSIIAVALVAVVTVANAQTLSLNNNTPRRAPYTPPALVGQKVVFEAPVVATNRTGNAITTVNGFTLYNVSVQPAQKRCVAYTDVGMITVWEGAAFDAHKDATLDEVMAALTAKIKARFAPLNAGTVTP